MAETRNLTLSPRQTADFEMIANGGFAPLTGFLGEADWKSSCAEMKLTSGEIWPIPVTLATDLECEVGDTIELSADDGKALGKMTVEEIFESDIDFEPERLGLTARSAQL